MTERLEQRYCIKFCQKLGDSQVETIRKIHTVFGDDAMGITQIKEWYNRFKDGRTSVESEPRSGRPSACRNDQVIAKVNAVVMRDRRLKFRKRLFRHASNNGGTAGRSVWSPKGTTLRVIRCPTIQVSQFLFPGQRSDTFLTDLV